MTLLLGVYFAFSVSTFLCVSCANVPEVCYEECRSRVVLDEDDFDVSCNDTCKVQKCHEGCSSWSEAVLTSCQTVCEEEQRILKRQWNLYCVMGCNIAINIYIKKMEDDLGIPSAPFLVADTRTNESIAIQWTPAPYHNISYLIQWRYETSHNIADWEYYKPLKPIKDNQLKVDGLHPYTKYKFRVAWILLPNYSPLFSEESVVISTLPYGVPSTAPTITCVTAAGYSRVSVSWDPPTFPNGPILSYVLYVREYLSGFVIIKDVSDTSGCLHYMFNNLQPSTTYIISVATRNNMGEGPADERNITTPSKEDVSNHHRPQPFLVFAAGGNVAMQGLRILDEVVFFYRSSNDSMLVTGIALHMKNNGFFFSNSLGDVNYVNTSSREIQPVVQASPNFPTLLSVDWLNEKLYMVEKDRISRCKFNGDHREIVLTDLSQEPTDMHVDPYNGYMYWVSSGGSSSGLYRIDLDVIHSTSSSADQAQLILKDDKLMSFSVDFINFRLLVPFADGNTIISTALDGGDVVDIRRNSQTSQFTGVKSIAVHRNLFYWTTGLTIFGEEYHPKEDKYYHNVYLIEDGPFSNLNIYHRDSQPHPVPLNPVESVQAVFKHDMAKISWSKPRLLGGLGKGAYQKWLYEMNVINHSTQFVTEAKNISKCHYVLHNLNPNSRYSISVRAYSVGGKGPWSSEFIGKTLKSGSTRGYPYILWSAREGLLKSNIVGDNVEPLIHKINLNNAHITDISWYNELLFLNTNASWVYIYNISAHHSLSRLANITNAASIAIDWFAPKLYWSSPVQQMISRANLDGSQPEPLPILTMARELSIDSPNGYLYWATSHSVECSRLNGADHFVYMKNDLFSGKHVMGLALDFDMNTIFWMVRSYEGSLMYKAPLASYNFSFTSEIEFELVGPLPEDDVRGPLWYFSDRLFWIHEHKEALVSDMSCHNIAALKGFGLNRLRTLAVVDPTLQPYPDGMNKDHLKVVPNAVRDKSVRIVGTWDSFNVTWEPTFISYGTLFYEMKINDGEEIYTMVTEEPVFEYPSMRFLSPYTPLIVVIKSYTYWASSKQTVVTLYSPMSTPSKPLHPRIFITYKSPPIYGSHDIIANFRWSPPDPTNGVILGYQVECWYIEHEKEVTVCSDVVDGGNLQFQLNRLRNNATYYFQVKAYTEIGEGPASDVVLAQTSQQSPVPQLLLAKTDAVKVADIDTHEEKLLSSKATHPAAVAYLALERKVFWIEEEGALMMSSLNGMNTSLIKSLPSQGTSLAVDWIGRLLYWAEVDKEKEYSSVWSMDLTCHGYSRPVINQSAIINSLEVEPFSRSLLWTVNSGKHCHLMICDSDGRNVRPFFWQPLDHQVSSNKLRVKRADVNKTCSCSPRPLVGRAFTVDSTTPTQPQVLWVDGRYGHIWSSDMQGCVCQLLVNASEAAENGLPPTSITVDSSRIYWSNKTLGKVYSISKETQTSEVPANYEVNAKPWSHSYLRKSILSETVRGVRGIRAIGDHLQPYPGSHCLFPEPYVETAKLVSRSSTSLTLYLPPVTRQPDCSKISMASILFTVFYVSYEMDKEYECSSYIQDTFCKNVSTQNQTLIIHDLHPFTNYSIRVSTSNFYSRGISASGPAVIYQTREGAPSAPVNVTAKPVSPFRIDVYWKPPVAPNGHPIWYEVRWRTENSHKIGKSAVYTEKPETSEDVLRMPLNSTESPGTTFYITVRAYSSGGDMYNDSEETVAATYLLPNNLTLLNATSNSLLLLWQSPNYTSISYHGLQYSMVNSGRWTLVATNQQTTPNEIYNFTVENLTPKTDYCLQMILTYQLFERAVIWPQENCFIFQTQGDKPGLPGEPMAQSVGKDVYKIVWNAAESNGGEDLIYELQMRSREDDLWDWITVSNDSQTQWIFESLSVNTNYEFRVRALNEYGSSNFSFSSEPFFLPEPRAYVESDESKLRIIIAASISVLILFVILLSIIYFAHKQCGKEKKKLQENAIQNSLVPDLELATLQELPRHGNFVHQTNALYNLGDIPVDEELIALPQIQRDQIILTKFLGSGAFGEVFEGIAHELEEDCPPTKVAIKTLRKGATDHEKEEFLKEAKLMSNFKHDHILKLLGVCFDNNPNFIILELMEGGDLLSFLRANRPTIFQPSALTLDDLLGICVDVAEGCKYLEEMHFVHRDLAARNCLVSSYDRESRIVKIGDFGLARDIYKNDYYRKEGEGLLPVRWMAPESLVYGVFTSQSDVWAFGVLLWEVMTLGQQPYPARANVEVLHYVRAGGRLDKPENCPDDLHQVMTRCWCYDPDSRPSFCFCLEGLEDLRRKSASSPMAITAPHHQIYQSNSYSGAYIITNDERNRDQEKVLNIHDVNNLSSCNDPSRITEMVDPDNSHVNSSFSVGLDPTLNEEPTTSTSSIIISNNEINVSQSIQGRNKYLELLADSEDIDGYEIPLRTVCSGRKPINQTRTNCGEQIPTKSPLCCLNKTAALLPHHTIDEQNNSSPAKMPLEYSQVFPLVLRLNGFKNNLSTPFADSTNFEANMCWKSNIADRAKSNELLPFQEAQIKDCGVKLVNITQCNGVSNLIGVTSLEKPVDSRSESDGSEESIENDHWSVSTASTVPCDADSTSSSPRNSGISTLSAVSGIDINYVPKSSWC